MKHIIKILIALCAVMLLSASAYANSDEQSQEAVLARNLIESLSENYVLPADSNANVTRAEFIYTLMESLNLSGAECSFEDVPEKHFAFNAIAASEDMGLTEQKTLFYPDRPITYQSAIEIAVSVLGYREKADYYGGYPLGYIRVANELRLTSGMNGKQMNSENVLMLIFNTINSYPLEASSIRKGGVSYIASNTTLLYRYRKIAYTEGIVTSDEASGLTNSKNSSAQDSISIDGVLYYGTNAENLLGRNCAVYYTEGLKNTIVCAAPYSNNIVNFEVNRYDRIENDTLMYNISDSKTDRIKLDGAYTVLYNRKATQNMNLDSIIDSAESGFVEAIDSNCDGRFDTVSVTSYEYAWVSAIDFIDKIIFDRVSGKSINLSSNELCLNVKILSEETLVDSDISEITPDTLIAYAMSEDAQACSVILCYDSVNTKISEVGESGGMSIVVAEDEKYHVNSFIYNFAKKLGGIDGEFCLGVNGEIVAVSGLAKDLMYGYIMELKEDNFSKSAWFLNEDGVVEQRNFAKSIKIDGIVSKTDDAWEDLKGIFESDDKSRLVRYKLKNGEIAQIDTAENISQITNFDELNNPDNSLALYCGGDLTFNAGAGFAPAFNIGGSTVNFVIPNGNSKNDISKYRTEPSGYFGDDNTYTIYAYDIGRNSMPAATLVVENESSIGVGYTTPSAIVSRIETVYDDDDNQVKAITLWQNGSFVRYLTTDDCLGDIETIEKGDIVRYAISKERIAYVKIDYDLSTNTIDSGVAKAGARLEFFKGKLFSVDEGHCYIYTGEGKITTPVDFTQLRSAKISGVQTALVEVDASGKVEVKNMPSDAVRDYYSSGDSVDSIVVRQNYYASQLNVIYRKLAN